MRQEQSHPARVHIPSHQNGAHSLCAMAGLPPCKMLMCSMSTSQEKYHQEILRLHSSRTSKEGHHQAEDVLDILADHPANHTHQVDPRLVSSPIATPTHIVTAAVAVAAALAVVVVLC